jgi:DNA-binding response OmpR family regulator
MDAKKTKNVFLVEDEKDLLELAVKYLKTKGYQVYSAISGEEALNSIHLSQADIILLDWMLPGLSGIDICRQLAVNPKTQDIPIVFMSAKTQMEEVSEALEEGAKYYITKPYSFSDLVTIIEKFAK